MVGAPNAINATLYEKLPFNFIRDIAPVAGILRVPLVMEVHPSVPVHTVPEFIAFAKDNPGKINYASAGIGGVTHVAGELFKVLGGVDMRHVPYRGAGPALTDLLGGQVQVMFDIMPSSIEYIRAGKLRALGVTTAERSEALPDLPTVGDFVPAYEASAWLGVGAPRNTPADIAILRRAHCAASDIMMMRRALLPTTSLMRHCAAMNIQAWPRSSTYRRASTSSCSADR